MAGHPKDDGAENPRMQCCVCRRWMRLHGVRSNGLAMQRFYGSCEHNHGGDHHAAENGDNDVCNECCKVECRRIEKEKIRNVDSGDWPDPGVEGGGTPATETG